MHGHTTHLIPFIISVQPGMLIHLCSLFYFLPQFLVPTLLYLRSLCRLEAHFQSKVQSGIQSGTKILPWRAQWTVLRRSIFTKFALRGLQRAPFCGSLCIFIIVHVLMRIMLKFSFIFSLFFKFWRSFQNATCSSILPEEIWKSGFAFGSCQVLELQDEPIIF